MERMLFPEAFDFPNSRWPCLPLNGVLAHPISLGTFMNLFPTKFLSSRGSSPFSLLCLEQFGNRDLENGKMWTLLQAVAALEDWPSQYLLSPSEPLLFCFILFIHLTEHKQGER